MKPWDNGRCAVHAALIRERDDLIKVLDKLIREIEDCSQPDHWDSYIEAKEILAKATSKEK